MSGPWGHATKFPLVPLGMVADLQLGKMLQPKPLGPGDVLVPYLRAGSISTSNGDDVPQQMFASPSDLIRFEVESGDLIVAEGGDCGQTAFVPPLTQRTIIQNSLHRIRSRTGNRFINYCLEAIYATSWLDVLCNKSTFGHLTREKLASLRIPFPNPSDQLAIVTHLDRETVRINALIAAKRRMAILLENDRQAAIDQAFTTGGKVLRLKHLVSRITSGPRGWAAYAADEGVLFLRIANISANSTEIDLANAVYVQPPEGAERRRTAVHSGDVLMSITAEIGSVGVARTLHDGAAVSQHVALLTPRMCSGDWLAYALCASHARAQLEAAAYGGTKVQLGLEDIGDISLPGMNASQQAAVLAALRTRIHVIQDAQRSLEDQVGLLCEYRQALITAAVTGQLDIPEAA